MTAPQTWPESAYQRALTVLAATCPGACPLETQRAWRLKLAARGIDPALVGRAVDKLTDTEGRPTWAMLLEAIRAELRNASLGVGGHAKPEREIAPNGLSDPDWNVAGLAVTRLVLARRVKADDFEREHRAEYERRKAGT